MKNTFWIIAIFAASFTSCTSLDHINQYSKTSVQGIQESEKLNLSFTKMCQQYSRQAFQYSIRTKPDDPKPQINCDDEKYADSILTTYQELITGYLSGLNKLSGGDLTNFNLTALANNIQGLNGKCSLTPVSDGQVAAAQSIASNLLKWAFDIYRGSRLKKIIQSTDVPLHNVIEAYKLSLLALKGRVNQTKADYNSFVFADNKVGYLGATNDIEKNKCIQERDAFYAMCDLEEAKIDAYITVLNSIETGHRNLAILSPSLQAAAVKSMVNQSAQNIQDLTNNFQKLLKK